jgi:hypothetical protein
MRLLTSLEIAIVSGAGSELPPFPGDGGDTTTGTGKNNNGYGNGAESGPPPGNSGDHNPQLLTWNSGKRGVR